MSSLEQINGITASALMQMATGFWVSKTLMTAVELEIFTKISSHQKDKNVQSITLKEFQEISGIRDSRPAEAFTTALVSLGLLNANKETRFKKEGDGLGMKAWEGDEQIKRVSYLVEKGLIEEVSNGSYRLTEKGISWKPKA